MGNKVVIGTAPDSWGIWVAEDPNQTPVDRFLDEVVEAGYEWIEIGAYGYLPTEPAKLRDALSSRRLKVSGGTAFARLQHPGTIDEVWQHVAPIASLTAAMGAEHVVIIPDLWRDDLTGNEKESRELSAEQWTALVDGHNELGRRMLEEYGVHSQFHSHADSHVGYQRDVERFVESTDPQFVNLCLDTGHIAYYGGDSVELITKYPDRIGYLHLKQVTPPSPPEPSLRTSHSPRRCGWTSWSSPPREYPDLAEVMNAAAESFPFGLRHRRTRHVPLLARPATPYRPTHLHLSGQLPVGQIRAAASVQELSMKGLPAALPGARTPDPRSAPGLRWGVLGTGWIADKFVTALHKHSSQRITAVGSRCADSAREFARRFGIEREHGSYEQLVSDPAVDVVYIATPHNAHLPHALLALRAGKHTVVEKPIALNAVQGQRIADEARSRGLFCMEAYWTAFLPKFDVLRQLLDRGIVGDVAAVVADFGEWFPAKHRIHRPELAGGPMLDLGTYLVSFVLDVVGPPDQIVASGTTTDTGVAGQTAMLLSRRDQRAVLHTTILANTPTRATIAGTAATIDIDGPFYQPGGFTLTTTDGGSRLRYDEPRIAHEGLHYQAAEVARRITAGETGSPIRPLSASIDVLRVMDEVRRQTRDRYRDEEVGPQ